jgi:hypothetical protein
MAGKITYDKALDTINKTHLHVTELKDKLSVTGNIPLSEIINRLECTHGEQDPSILINYASLRYRLTRDFAGDGIENTKELQNMQS